MVKDLLREIKRKWFQFIALTLITSLGVGFFVGIQVTGYDMRQTADAYMDDRHVLDYKIIHTLGIDEEMVQEVGTLIEADVAPVIEDDMFARGKQLDDVLKVYAYTEETKKDLTLLEGRLPNNRNEVVIDAVMETLYNFEINDTLQLIKNNVFETVEVQIVGFVESSLYLNLERGQSQLGIGKVSGFVYGYDLPLQDEEITYTSLRIKDAQIDDPEYILKRNEEILSKNRFDRLIVPQLEALEKAQDELDKARNNANLEFEKAEIEFSKAQAKLDRAYQELEDGLNQLSGGIVFSGSVEERLELARLNHTQLQTMLQSTLDTIRDRINETENELVREALQKELDAGILELEEVNQQFNSGISQLELGLAQYQAGEKELNENRERFEKEKADALFALDKNQAEIDRGYADIDNADHGDLHVLDREASIIGYREFYDDSNRIEKIGQVFPIIFFFVAILVTLSTVTRMIEENRMEMGVYKALGYGAFRTSMKYILFTGISWLVGSLIGLYFGFFFIPRLIYDAYRIMYLTPELVDGVVWSYAYIPLIMSFLSSVGVTFAKSMKVSKERAANLLRPVPPKSGQRIFLERVPGIWRRMSFLYKVSFRNLFRNKMRFFMTMFGIGATTGLLIIGFGIGHSIYSIADIQFEEVIHYDGLIYYDEMDFDTSSFTDSIEVYVEGMEIQGYEVSFYSTDDLKRLDDFIHMSDRKTQTPLEYGYDDVILTEKLARLLDLEVGDKLDIRVDNRNVNLEVAAITQHYTGHNIYTSHQTLVDQGGHIPKDNMLLFKTDVKDHDALAEILMAEDSVVAVQFLDEISKTYSDMTKNFDVVIWVVVIAALSLEILVLVNLISMNMSEREKELATLKVLGFKKNELATYVLRENIILTIMATAFGFVFGKVMHYFVVTQAEIDLVMFNYELLWTSYLYAFLLTMGLSILINFVMARRANQVNMSEALKTFDE